MGGLFFKYPIIGQMSVNYGEMQRMRKTERTTPMQFKK
jgi:hypothetical protein